MVIVLWIYKFVGEEVVKEERLFVFDLFVK